MRNLSLAALLVLFTGLVIRAQENGVKAPGDEELPPVFVEQPVRWYRSNSAGMSLEQVYSRASALRHKYSLSIGPLSLEDLPGELLPYYAAYMEPLRIELRILYEEGKESRRQFLFYEAPDLMRLIAVLTKVEPEPNEEGEPENEGKLQGFIELYNKAKLLVEAHQLLGSGSEYITRYFYQNQVLVRAETLLKELPPAEAEEGEGTEFAAAKIGEPVTTLASTDQYRYTRSGSLRMVERTFHRPGETDEVSQSRFPPLSRNFPVDPEFVRPALAYRSEFLRDSIQGDAFRIRYTTDERGRVLTETREDASGKELAVIRNTWSGDRLMAVNWTSGEDERRTEYEYDQEGDRIAERNYNKNKLERVVRQEGKREVEDLYMNGQWVLRALWEDGRKISEERIRPSAAAVPPGGEP